ncbi:MAG: DUF1499 domain-containing protein [Spongiibacteraceae bacterium]
MSIITPSQPAKTAVFIRNIAIVLLLLLPIAALGTRADLWPYTIGLMLVSISLLGSLLLQVINAIWLWCKPAAATQTTLRWASLFALPPLIMIASMIFANTGARAPIHNISTDTENPPEFIAAIEQRGDHSNPLDYSTNVADIQRQTYPELGPISTTLNPAQAFDQALKSAQAMGWDIYAQDVKQGRIEAVATTLWFGFKDDIVIRIQTTEAGSKIDLRSVSRVGHGDMGANAKRIKQFTKTFNQLSK